VNAYCAFVSVETLMFYASFQYTTASDTAGRNFVNVLATPGGEIV